MPDYLESLGLAFNLLLVMLVIGLILNGVGAWRYATRERSIAGTSKVDAWLAPTT